MGERKINTWAGLAIGPTFGCGHSKIPKNAYVSMTNNKLYIRCKECHQKQARDFYERKK